MNIKCKNVCTLHLLIEVFLSPQTISFYKMKYNGITSIHGCDIL